MSEELIQSTLDEMLFHENKLVTYKWISKKFRMHVNEAKQCLEKFYVKSQGDRNLNAVYYLSGYKNYEKTKVDFILKIRLVRDSDLDIAERDFIEILSKHVYSLQCCDLKDLTSVFLADDDEGGGLLNEFSSIKLASIQFRAENQPKIEVVDKVEETNESGAKAVTVNGSKKTTTPKIKQTITSMFTAMETNNKNGKEIKKPSSNDKPLASYVEPVAAKKLENGDKKFLKTTREKLESRTRNKRETAVASRDTLKNEDLYEAESSPEKSPTKGLSDSPTLRRSPRKHGCMLSPSAKKSKIIKMTLPQEEEDEIEEDEDIVPPTPTSPVLESKKVIKKQKLVNKTYLDDDGYLVTSKEPVVETSEEEQTNVPKAEPASPKKRQNLDDPAKKPAKGKKNKMNPSPKKQSSLTSFFKK